MHCLVLFIDFSKAFDTLSHLRLLQIMERNGIRGKTLNWFKNYLECRKYRVKINNSLSDEVVTDFGVPQGSKLGPILYIMYANDMINTLQGNTTYAYADDTAIVVSNENINDAMKIMQSQLNIATRWCHDNGLIINAQKTKIMHIKPRHFIDTDIKIKFHDMNCLHNINNINDTCTTYIELVTTYKYLGVYVDNNFKWNTHVDYLQKKLRKSAFMLYHLSNCATYNVLRQAYFAVVESYLRHGIAAWGNASHCRLLQNSQDRILKILKKNLQYQQIHDNRNINTINNNIVNTNNNNNNYNDNNIRNNIENNTNNSILNIINNSTIYNINTNNNIVNTNNYNNNNNRNNTENNTNNSILNNNNLNNINVVSNTNNDRYSNSTIYNINTINNIIAHTNISNNNNYDSNNNSNNTENNLNNNIHNRNTNNNLNNINTVSNINNNNYNRDNCTNSIINNIYSTTNNNIANTNNNNTLNNNYVSNNNSTYNRNTSNNLNNTNNINTISNTNNIGNINNTTYNIGNINNTTYNIHTSNNISNNITNATAIFNNNSNSSQSNCLANELHVLKVKSIYYTTLAIEFYNDARFLQKIDHQYNTRRRNEGRFKVGSFQNNYGKSTLNVTLPKLFNSLPVSLLNIPIHHKRKKLLKNFFISSQ
ncbi:putative uncharacterized protein DDB_G0282133 [Lucilia cuprina]|uniref:putative uncharacterized protein DDB_G0282133 n=1 Tax=Lucilia cuprina TaxID=7375 RepID=UPI001F057CED|nr:putative uncharacterized protein DDB_G0282133 [Lucilia cuprina]